MLPQDKNAIFHASIGDVVRAWREEQNLTVTELAQLSGPPISKGYISQLEHNKVRQPSDEHLVRIAAAVKVPVLFLVTRRLPDELTAEEQAELSVIRNSAEEEGGFAFGSPIRLTQRKEQNEEEELRQILAQLDELRSRVKKLIVKKGRQH